MIESITIKQAWNGWIIEYIGSNGDNKSFVFQEWKDVLSVINKNFGFLDENDNATKNATLTYQYKRLPELY